MKLQLVNRDIVVESAGIDGAISDLDITPLTNGNLLVTWAEYLSQPTDEFDDTDGAVFARILDGDGTAISETIQVNDFAPHLQDSPKVVAATGGSFGIGWTNTATYGDGASDADIFMKFFDSDGSEIPGFFLDVVEDTPGELPEDHSNEELQEIIGLSGNRFAILSKDKDPTSGTSAYIYDSGGALTTTIGSSSANVSVDDMVQLANGNIVAAGVSVSGTGDDGIALKLFNSNFLAPDGFTGIYEPLSFHIDGSPLTQKAENNLQLAALGGGGFALAFVEESDAGRSVIQLSLISDHALEEADEIPIVTRNYEFDSEKAEFDMIGLSGGGLALAVTRPDSGVDTSGVDIMLFDADGKLQTKMSASASDEGDQAHPSLVELDDGRIALAFTDVSATGNNSNPMSLAFFEVTDGVGKFIGTAGDDVLAGVGGNDRILGGDGDDTIRGRNGNDRLFGEDGNDRLLGGNGKDALRGGGGNDTLLGGSGHDGLGGGAGRDRLEGGAGRDILGGGAGNDRLIGGAGDDWLKGGAGNDLMKGGGGSDTFHFVRGRSGTDTVQDFDAAEDILSINLRGGKAAQVEVEASGGDTVVSFGSASVTLQDVTLAKADIDFLFS